MTADPRDAAPQRVHPLVVRVERADPPTRTDALEAAAIAVLTLLADPRSHPTPPPVAPLTGGPAATERVAGSRVGDTLVTGGPAATDRVAGSRVGDASVPGGPPAAPETVGGGDAGHGGRVGSEPGAWADAVREWADARIRKVVRRARGAEWRRAEALDGITVARRTAEVRVFPPVPLDGWPRDLARLQVSGTELVDPSPPGPPPAGVPVLWLSPHLELSAGKAMAQVGHAAQLGWDALDERARDGWRAAGFELAVRTATPDRWEVLLRAGLPLVRDAGFTEIAPGSCTAVADHPALRR